MVLQLCSFSHLTVPKVGAIGIPHNPTILTLSLSPRLMIELTGPVFETLADDLFLCFPVGFVS